MAQENMNIQWYPGHMTKTRRQIEADLKLVWINADNPKDTWEVTLHAIGTNDGGPDKAKGSAWTYCLKYYLFEKFGIDQGEDDPDNTDRANEPQNAHGQGAGRQNGKGRGNTQPQARNGQSGHTGGSQQLSKAQMERMYRKGEAAGYTQGQIGEWIANRYKQQDPRNMTREQYDEVCGILDNMAKQGGNSNA